MSRVLLIGNGFDLSHKLPTSYSNFLYVMEHIDALDTWVKSYKQNSNDYSGGQGLFREGLKIEDEDIARMINLLRGNTWTKYYLECGAQIQGWIDFENEMKPALRFWNTVLKSDILTYTSNGMPKGRVIMPEQWMLRQAHLWQGEFFDIIYENDKFANIKSDYVQRQYGALSKKIIDKLLKDLDDFTEAFCIYLSIFASKEGIEKIAQIEKINPNVIIDFNYTSTELLYNNWQAKTYHVHGGIMSNNAVLGINELEELSDDFIPFLKYYQRIKKRCDIDYRKYTEGVETIELLAIYGCSMDETDSDILIPLISGSNQTDIYYYNTNDYNSKLMNLIRLFGRKKVEEYIFHQNVCFIKIDGVE